MAETSDQRGSSKLKFTVWDLLLLTAFVAVIFALPDGLLELVAAASTAAILNLLFLAYFSVPSKQVKKGTINHWFRQVIGRVFLFSLVVCVVSSIAILLKHANG